MSTRHSSPQSVSANRWNHRHKAPIRSSPPETPPVDPLDTSDTKNRDKMGNHYSKSGSGASSPTSPASPDPASPPPRRSRTRSSATTSSKSNSDDVDNNGPQRPATKDLPGEQPDNGLPGETPDKDKNPLARATVQQLGAKMFEERAALLVAPTLPSFWRADKPYESAACQASPPPPDQPDPTKKAERAMLLSLPRGAPRRLVGRRAWAIPPKTTTSPRRRPTARRWSPSKTTHRSSSHGRRARLWLRLG